MDGALMTAADERSHSKVAVHGEGWSAQSQRSPFHWFQKADLNAGPSEIEYLRL